MARTAPFPTLESSATAIPPAMYRCLLLLLLALTWSSCKALAEEWLDFLHSESRFGSSGPTFEDVEGTDDTVLPVLHYQHELRLPSLQLGEGDRLLLDLSLSSGDGDFALNLPAGRNTKVGGTVLSGNMDGEITMLEAGIALDFRQQTLEWVTTDVLIGVGYHDLSLALRSSSATGKEDIGRFGALAGGRAAARLTDWLSAYVRGTILILPADTSSTQVETGFDIHIADHVDLLLGYRVWNYHHDHGPAEYDLDLQGLMAGLTVHF